MNPAFHAAIYSATHKASSESIEARLRAAGALGHATAMAFEPADATERKLVGQGIASGVFVRNAQGHLYLNERALADRRQGQGWIALVVLLVVNSLLASGVALALAL